MSLNETLSHNIARRFDIHTLMQRFQKSMSREVYALLSYSIKRSIS